MKPVSYIPPAREARTPNCDWPGKEIRKLEKKNVGIWPMVCSGRDVGPAGGTVAHELKPRNPAEEPLPATDLSHDL